MKHWKVHFDWLLKRPKDHNIILVRYEDLKQDLLREMERILTFLQFPYTCKLLLLITSREAFISLNTLAAIYTSLEEKESTAPIKLFGNFK